tara:strand:- start:6015 stop:6410 length:396 start_codon:yes stop_codon:yes gene_type:complete
MNEQNFKERARQIFDENYKLEKPRQRQERIPPGEYVCKTIKGEFFRSSRKQTPGYKITFIIVEGEHKSRLLWADVWLTPKCKGRARKAFDELGISGLEDELNKDKTYIVDVESDEYNGVVRAKVVNFESRN